MYPVPKLAEKYLNDILINDNRSEGTIRSYSNSIKIFFEFMLQHKKSDLTLTKIDKKFIQNIDKNDIDAYLTYLALKTNKKGEKISITTRVANIAAIREMFKYFVDKNIIENNPTTHFKIPKIPKRIPAVMTLDESKELLSNIESRNKERDIAIITLFLHSGVRLSELVNINVEDIKKDTLRVIGKGNKERIVYLSNTAIKTLNEYINIRNPNTTDKALFLNEDGKRLSKIGVQYIVKKHLKKTNLDTQKYHTHSLRHTAATLMYKSGKVGIRQLQEILGHSDINTTEKYTHIDNEQLKEAVNANPLNEL